MELAKEEEKLATFSLEYTFYGSAFDVHIKYDKKDAALLRRVGIAFSLPLKENDSFTYYAYGPYESYIDKRLACKVGKYTQKVEDALSNNLKPQECGSHYFASFIDLPSCRIDADRPFSFSVLPYSKEELENAKHNYDLPKPSGCHVSLDLAMAGVGTHSCGPELKKEYEIPNSGEITFRITLKRK